MRRRREPRNPTARSKDGASKLDAKEGGKLWRVVVLPVARDEGRKILKKGIQYEHIVELLKCLSRWGNRREMAHLDIRPFNQFYELREKGGPLLGINFRAYFAVLRKFREIVVLKAYKKEEDHQTAPYVLTILENRLEAYEERRRLASVSVHPKGRGNVR